MNTLLGAALTLLATYKAARAAWQLAHPGQGSPFVDDEQLFDMLRTDSEGLTAHADAVLRKYAADQVPTAGTDG